MLINPQSPGGCLDFDAVRLLRANGISLLQSILNDTVAHQCGFRKIAIDIQTEPQNFRRHGINPQNPAAVQLYLNSGIRHNIQTFFKEILIYLLQTYMF